MRWMVRGDLDGFFGLAVDNLVQLILINVLCTVILGFSPDLIYGNILPGVAVSLLIGNLYYAWQACNLASETGRDDVCALPYGINTPSLIAYVFLIMLPAKLVATQEGHEDPARMAWQVGLVACFGSGVIEVGGAYIAEWIRRSTPRAALLSTLSGIALGFISLGFLFQTFAHPIVGMGTLGIILLTYFGKVRFKGGIPGGLIAVALGTILAWSLDVAPVGPMPSQGLQFHFPIPVLGDLFGALTGPHALTYFSIILPMGIFNVLGSLQNIESAESAGDAYPTRPSLIVNGLGSMAASVFGSCFPTTIYIGHPGWKGMGARAGYSILNGVFMTVVCLTGSLAYIVWAIPIDAGMAIVLWIGIVITAQAFQAVPREHAPATVIGILPGVAAWGVFIAEATLRVAGYGIPGGPAFTDELFEKFQTQNLWIQGGFALEQGFIFTAMILSAVTVFIIEKKFRKASLWCLFGAALSFLGLMHSYQYAGGDVVAKLVLNFQTMEFEPEWKWGTGYLVMAFCLGIANWVTEPGEAH